MIEPIHPARRMPYDTLMAGLERARGLGFVHRRPDPTTGLQLFIYTERCVYDGGWDEFAVLARGLIVEPAACRVVATPFPKFFNLGERQGDIPDLPFEAFEKLDGSLIIVFHHDGSWRTATKGAFGSEQARWAQARLDAADLSALTPGTTYLFEAVYPENRIVVRYPDPALVMLAAYDAAGRETEYRRIHALISRCTPLAVWDAIFAGDDLAGIRRDLPEEFWADFDTIVGLLTARITDIETSVAEVAATVAHLSDKEVGLSLGTLPEDVRPHIFGFRKAGAIVGKARSSLLRFIRPTANVLPGYVPSYAMHRVMEDAA